MEKHRNCSYREILIINAKPLSEVSKHERAVLFKLEMARHVLSVFKTIIQGKQSTQVIIT